MLKLLIATLLCFCLATSEASRPVNGTKRGHYLQSGYAVNYPSYWNYPYSDYYYSWYNWCPTQFTVVPKPVAVPACNICPSACPGTCGTWSGFYACQVTTCPLGNIHLKISIIYELILI